MRVEAAGIIDGSSPERLTRAIRRGFAAIETKSPGVLAYDNTPLGGAMQRRLYQEALLNPARLLALVKADGDRETFAEWLPQRVPGNALIEAYTYVKAWARLIYRGTLGVAWQHETRNETLHPEFIFYTLRPHFVDFFRPIIERLGARRCALYCEPGYGVEETAANYGLAVCQRIRAPLRLRALRWVPKSMFRLYAGAVVDLLEASGTLQRYQPRAVVFAEAASAPEEIAARAARALGIATLRVQYGRAGLMSPGYYEMPYDKMLMWGDGFVERLRYASPDCQYIVTGSPLMDKLERGTWRADTRLFPDDKNIVTVISQPECANISRQDYETLVTVVDQVLASTDTINVLVRLHPADKALDFHRLATKWPDRLRVTTPGDFPLEVVIGHSVLVVGLYSTVLSEAVAADVLPVAIRLGERHRIFPSPEEEGAAVLAESPEEAVTRISLLATEATARKAYEAGMRAFAKKYFGPMDGGAIARIVEQIENAA